MNIHRVMNIQVIHIMKQIKQIQNKAANMTYKQTQNLTIYKIQSKQQENSIRILVITQHGKSYDQVPNNH